MLVTPDGGAADGGVAQGGHYLGCAASADLVAFDYSIWLVGGLRSSLDDLLGRPCSRTAVLYHGDFDWRGIAIARRIFRRGAHPWRFGYIDYLAPLAFFLLTTGLA